jgi:hypothetical protein
VYEFCLTKCPIYRRHKGNINEDGTGPGGNLR